MYEYFKTANKDKNPAHWFSFTTPNKNGEVMYCCSKCRGFASFTDNDRQKYCGNCGAKMRGSEDGSN